MNGFRCLILSLSCLVAFCPSAHAQSAVMPEITCKIYPLKDLGDDPNLGTWIADTLPKVIQPSSWNQPQASARCTLSYFPPAKVLVVYHTTAVHRQVEDFLKNLQQAMPAPQSTAAKKRLPDAGVVPAHYSAASPSPMTESKPNLKASGYPIPAPLQQPKHLFHLVVRFEGESAIESAVTVVAKNLGATTEATEEKGDKNAPAPATPASGLFQFIVRYEGEGLVDENVVAFMKAMKEYSEAGERQVPTVVGPPAVAPVYSYAPPTLGTTPAPACLPARQMPLADSPPATTPTPQSISTR